MKHTRSQRALAILLLLAMSLGFYPDSEMTAQALPPPSVGAQGQLSTTDGTGISETQLRTLLDTYVPEANSQSRLLVLTQCFGGNMVDTLTAGTAKTTVLSATSEGQKAVYGGYDDNAAGALRPGAGRSSEDVHAAGTAGKAASETPTRLGPIASLEPVSPDGAIKSRHVLVYAGKPDSKPGRDVTQRKLIVENFAHQPPPTTTVTTVGGAGSTEGWDYPGTLQGMTDALKSIQAKMGPDEQFILFVTDHGGEMAVATPQCTLNQCVASGLSLPVEGVAAAMEDPENVPFVTLFTSSTELVPPPIAAVSICPPAGECLLFPEMPFLPFDLNQDGDLSDAGDGFLWQMPIPEPLILTPISVTATGTMPPLIIHEAGLQTGPIAKSPETTSAVAHATLATSSGPSIYDDQLRALLDAYVPATNAHSSLLVFTQCYGGDMLDNFSGRANTAALSATATGGQEAEYGGYHDDAAAALYPGAGRSSTDVHSAGTAGKHPDENPTSAGSVVSLEPVSAKVIAPSSRHVLFYAGENGELGGMDVADRNQVVANFSGQPNTTVTTVGFSGGPGWDHPATVEGLRAALQGISAQMGPGEQFILFVGDHGDYEMVDDTPVCEGDGTCQSEPFAFPSGVKEDMAGDAHNSPGVGVLLPAPSLGPVTAVACDSFFDICFELVLPPFQPLDLDGDGTVNLPGEGFYARMPLPEGFILHASGVIVRLFAPPGTLVSRISLESGEIARGMQHFYLPMVAR